MLFNYRCYTATNYKKKKECTLGEYLEGRGNLFENTILELEFYGYRSI